MKRVKPYLLALLLLCSSFSLSAQTAPKREFRGAWIQCVNNQFKGLTPDSMRTYLLRQLNHLQGAGINAIIFQVRAEADALYRSSYEPWSRYLTGRQGVAPSPGWDPLQFMVDECHRRGMELHAWINPYRAKTKGTDLLAASHPCRQHPELFIEYDGQLYFDPGLPESRRHILKIVRDIVSRYDVDAIHMDDYFYPYPVPGLKFRDDVSFSAYGAGFSSLADWRRNNVNTLVRELHEAIHAVKPWVKFGISPFGIYRNKKTDPNGSDTRGLQNYDDLYADVLAWVNNGWIDYSIPQVYWEIGHPAADYDVLVRWWAEHASSRPLYIGQDVMRTVTKTDPAHPQQHQMRAKYHLQRSLPGIQGSCQWYSAAVVQNPGNYSTLLSTQYHKYPALQPSYPFIDKKAPHRVRRLKAIWTEYGYILFWTASHSKDEMNKAVRYVIYRFADKEKVNLSDPSHIVSVTSKTFYELPYTDGTTRYRYVVTALDRLNNESRSRSQKVEL